MVGVSDGGGRVDRELEAARARWLGRWVTVKDECRSLPEYARYGDHYSAKFVIDDAIRNGDRIMLSVQRNGMGLCGWVSLDILNRRWCVKPCPRGTSSATGDAWSTYPGSTHGRRRPG
jgi:hypothetical protein